MRQPNNASSNDDDINVRSHARIGTLIFRLHQNSLSLWERAGVRVPWMTFFCYSL